MFRPRVIPCLLLYNRGLVKTIRFQDPTYVGDPINAVKIYNDLEADELVFLDITASKENRMAPLELVQKIGDEAFMPFAVGGGIKTLEDIRNVFHAGAEKVVINTAAIENEALIRQAADTFGSQSIVVSIDAKRKPDNTYEVMIYGGAVATGLEPACVAAHMEQLGAGEIIINSIDRDGTEEGYDIPLISTLTRAVDIPVIALGGAGRLEDFQEAVRDGGASAVAAGSIFVFIGRNRAVLINYPDKEDLEIIRFG